MHWGYFSLIPTNLSSVHIHSFNIHLHQILDCIHVPQFKNFNTIRISLSFPSIQAVATNGSSHTFQFLQVAGGFKPLQRLGAEITTLRLDREMGLEYLYDGSTLCKLLTFLARVQVLKLDVAVADRAWGTLCYDLSTTGDLPGLKVIRAAIGPDCGGNLQFLASILKQRMLQGYPPTIEPFLADAEDGWS